MTEKGIELILNELKSVNERITAMETIMESMEAKMATKEDIKSLERKIKSVSDQVIENAEGITDIRNKLKKLDLTVDVLSRRSIDQEAELKRIK
ncbi:MULTISPECIES: hypothetical protein [Oceanobacillus]|uniref:Uncharacterized protein n=1 Tax=Oceanobacillus indicireducens TaxID=1004261 RepID=A0A917Y4K3_9BACI|nr:hypothetical protein [Oceanobacillus indicireducens]GGN67354.1 hypothetical protein GCM10007971_38160 [Oceanobacillus indicireducens]